MPSKRTPPSTPSDFSKRDLTLADDSQTSVRLTIWGKAAESFEAPVEAVIAFKGAKVSDFGGRSLSLLASGSMTVEPDIEEAHKLRGWYDAVGQSTNFATHQSMAASGGNAKQETKLIADVVAEETYLQEDTPSYFTIKASVVYVKNTTIAYPACQKPDCNKKVIEEAPEEWWCEKCQKKWPKPEYRYVLSANVADHTGAVWLSCFDDAGRMIMGMPANDLIEMKEEDEAKYMNAMQEATCKTFNFRVRAKMETYQEQPK
jgi:replication factor A1